MNKEPLVALIMLNWNEYNYTKNALNSLNKIIYKNKKIILFDNGSDKKEYLKLKKEFENVEFIRSESNLGYSGGCNKALKYALKKYNPKYTYFLNNDCTFEKDFLSKVVEALEKNDTWGIAGSKMNYMDHPDIIWAAGGKISKYFATTKLVMNKKKDNYKKEEYVDVDYTNGLVRTELYRKIGFLDNNYFIYSEETDFCYRAKKEGYEIKCRLDSVMYHKVSLTDQKIKGFATYYMTRNRIYFIKKNFVFPYNFLSFCHLLFISFPMYLVYYPLYYKDFFIVKAYLKGTFDGLTGKMGKTSFFEKKKK